MRKLMLALVGTIGLTTVAHAQDATEAFTKRTAYVLMAAKCSQVNRKEQITALLSKVQNRASENGLNDNQIAVGINAVWNWYKDYPPVCGVIPYEVLITIVERDLNSSIN